MSHIYLPDGILPVWLWVSGYVVAILVGTILFQSTKKEGLRVRKPKKPSLFPMGHRTVNSPWLAWE